MTNKTEGGLAFPRPATGYQVGQDGMTLRDYFAGQSLAGVMVACQHDTRLPDETSPEMFARKAYAIADAMIAARDNDDNR